VAQWAYLAEDNLADEPEGQEFDCFEVGLYQGGFRLSSRALVYGFEMMEHRYHDPRITIEKLSTMITWGHCRLNGFVTKTTHKATSTQPTLCCNQITPLLHRETAYGRTSTLGLRMQSRGG
jgi:hypothetical protein